VLIFDV